MIRLYRCHESNLNREYSPLNSIQWYWKFLRPGLYLMHKVIKVHHIETWKTVASYALSPIVGYNSLEYVA